MRQLLMCNLLTILLVLAPGGAALGQQAPTPVPLVAPPGPATRSATRFDVVDAPQYFDQVLQIVDFPTGAWTSLQAPGGGFYLTVLDGEVSIRTLDNEETYAAGSTFTSGAGQSIQVGNVSHDRARVIVTLLLPRGAEPTTVDQPGSDDGADSTVRPTTVFQASVAVERPAGAFGLVHLVLDMDPGVWTPKHVHGGQEQVIVTTGQMTLRRGDQEEVFATGESWVNAGGVVHAAGNADTSFAQVVVAILLPAGKPLTTVM